MQLAHRVALNGNEFDAADDRIMIQKIEVGAGKENIGTTSLMDGSGSRVTNMHRDSIDITVKFCIRYKKRNMAERETVLEKANKWAAGGGWLTTNYKTGRRIMVFMAQAAAANDPWDWTQVYQIVFRACGVPYWQESTAQSLTRSSVSSVSSGASITVNGSAETVCDVSFKNTSGSTVDTFDIKVGDSEIKFGSLGLGNNETLEIDHDDSGKRCVLRMRIKNTSGVYRTALDKRTTLTSGAPSSDDLFVMPGTRAVTMSAGGNGDLTVNCCGRFA